MTLRPTREQRDACNQAADLLASQAEGLRQTGSVKTVSAFAEYVSTLRKIGAASEVELTAKEKIDVEQSTFVLEGSRDGLLTAEFRDRANKIGGIIRWLNEIVAAYNAAS